MSAKTNLNSKTDNLAHGDYRPMPDSLVVDALTWAESDGVSVDRKIESRLLEAGRWGSASENACEILAGYIRKMQSLPNTADTGTKKHMNEPKDPEDVDLFFPTAPCWFCGKGTKQIWGIKNRLGKMMTGYYCSERCCSKDAWGPKYRNATFVRMSDT